MNFLRFRILMKQILIILLIITVSGCAYKKSIKFGMTATDEAVVQASDIDKLIASGAQVKTAEDYGLKDEGFYFKPLPEDYNPTLLPDSLSNRNKTNMF